MSDEVKVEELKKAFLDSMQHLSEYHEFRDLRGKLSTKRHVLKRKHDCPSVADIYKGLIDRQGAKKLSRKKKTNLLEQAKEIFSERMVGLVERKFVPDENLGKTIARELPWPKNVPKEVRDAENALYAAQSKIYDGQSSDHAAVTMALENVNSCVQMWTKNTVDKARRDYRNALMEQTVDIKI